GNLPDAVHARRPDAGRPARAPPRTGGAVQRPDAPVRDVPRDERLVVLREQRPLDGPGRSGRQSEPPVRGVLRRHADAGRAGARVPPPPADGAQAAAEHDRLDRRPERSAALRRGARLPVPPGHDRHRAEPDRGEDRRGADDQLAGQPVGCRRQHGHQGQSHRPAHPGFAAVPPADLPEVDERGVPAAREDRPRHADDGRLGRHAPRVAEPAARRRLRPWRRADPGPEPIGQPGAERDAGTRSWARCEPARRRPGARRVRERPLRARAGGAPGRRLRDVRPRDRPRPGCAPPPERPRPCQRGTAGLRQPKPRPMTGSSPGVVGESVVAAPDEGGARLAGRSRSAGWIDGLAWATSQTLARPSTWVVALAGFLARGGILLLLVPILPLPSPVGIANIVGPAVVTPAGPSSQGIAILVSAGIVVVGWVVLGVLIGAATDGYL